jgi:hypothetical protein
LQSGNRRSHALTRHEPFLAPAPFHLL